MKVLASNYNRSDTGTDGVTSPGWTYGAEWFGRVEARLQVGLDLRRLVMFRRTLIGCLALVTLRQQRLPLGLG